MGDFVTGIKDVLGAIGSAVDIGKDVASVVSSFSGGGGTVVAQQPAQTNGAGGAPFFPGLTDRENLLMIASRDPARVKRIQTDSPGLDVIDSGEAQEFAFARLLHERGVIAANSDAGALLLDRGHKPKQYRVKLTDGRHIRVWGFPVGGKKARRINYTAPAKIRDAARTMRAAHRHLDTFRRLGIEGSRLDAKVRPKRKACACKKKKKSCR